MSRCGRGVVQKIEDEDGSFTVAVTVSMSGVPEARVEVVEIDVEP